MKFSVFRAMSNSGTPIFFEILLQQQHQTIKLSVASLTGFVLVFGLWGFCYPDDTEEKTYSLTWAVKQWFSTCSAQNPSGVQGYFFLLLLSHGKKYCIKYI